MDKVIAVAEKFIAVAEFVIRMGFVVFVFCGIDLVNGRTYENAMACGMIYLLMNWHREARHDH